MAWRCPKQIFPVKTLTDFSQHTRNWHGAGTAPRLCPSVNVKPDIFRSVAHHVRTVNWELRSNAELSQRDADQEFGHSTGEIDAGN
jgi:hypothetical protein